MTLSPFGGFFEILPLSLSFVRQDASRFFNTKKEVKKIPVTSPPPTAYHGMNTLAAKEEANIMCGIIGYISKSKAGDILMKGLKKLNYRGYDSSGIAVLHNQKIHITKTAGKIENLEKAILSDNSIQSASIGIGHTRWATHGEANEINAHPHYSKNKKFAIVHNGIIDNYQELKKNLEDKGYQFISDTDTEVIAHLLEYHYRGDPFEAIQKTTQKLKGSYAVALLCDDCPDMILGFRKNNPLLVGLTKSCGALASDMFAMRFLTKDFIEPNENEIAIVTKDVSVIVDYNLERVPKKILTANFDEADIELGEYAHYMLKEIFDQPKAIEKTIKHLEPQLTKLSLLDDIQRINIIACGSSYNAGFAAKHFIESIAKIPVNVEMASEYRYAATIKSLPKTKALTIAISQSGETADTIGAVQEAKKNSKVLSVVNVEGSAITRLSDATLLTKAGPEIAVATTKGYLTQAAALFMLGIELENRLMIHKSGHPKPPAFNNKVAQLKKLPNQIQSLLKNSDHIQKIAAQFSSISHAFFLGRGIDFGIAQEGALKLKELSYIHAQAYPAGELKHGTIALIEKGSLVVAISTNKKTEDKMLSSIKEVKARGAVVLALSPFDKILDAADHKIKLVNGQNAPLLAAIHCQLLSYYIALDKGCNIDMPRNLAKSVTVE